MKKELFFILLIVVIAAFCRFYHVSNYLYFTVDEERDAFIMKKILRDKQPTLIGPAVPKLTYLGPFYFNFSAIFFKLVNLDIVKMGYIASLIGVINVILLFFTVQNICGRRIAYVTALIYAVSFLIVIYNRNYWPLTYTQFAVIGTYYCLDKIRKGKESFLYWLTIPLIIGVQSEPTCFSLIPLSLIVIAIKKIRLKKAAIPFLLLIFSHVSLLIFDFRHNHLLWNMLMKYFSGAHRVAISNMTDLLRPIWLVFLSFIRSFYIFGPADSSLQIAPIGNYFIFRSENIPPVAYFLAVLCVLFLVTRIKDQKIVLPMTHVFFVILGIASYNFFFPGYTFEWFTNCLFPAFAILWAYIIVNAFKKKILILAVLILIVSLNLRAVIIGGNSFSIKSKIEAVKWSSQEVRGAPFELISIGGWLHGGYRYLFEKYGTAPAKSYQDALFAGWVYPINNIKPKRKVIFVSEKDFKDQKFMNLYELLKKQATKTMKFGNIEVLII